MLTPFCYSYPCLQGVKIWAGLTNIVIKVFLTLSFQPQIVINIFLFSCDLILMFLLSLFLFKKNVSKTLRKRALRKPRGTSNMMRGDPGAARLENRGNPRAPKSGGKESLFF